MQENLGYAAMTETPCVIVDAQRGGPSTGMPTLPSQGDVMQARWGTHGDRPALVLTACSVADVYAMTVEAFNLSELHRVPVVLLLDATLAHAYENVDLPDLEVVDRRRPASVEGFEPFGGPEFLPFGEGARFVVTGLTHDETGHERTSDGFVGERLLRRAVGRLADDTDRITHVKRYRLEDATLVLLAYGITARGARAAVDVLRDEGLPAGLLELQTLWPFPDQLVGEVAQAAEAMVVPELNLGQLALSVRAAAGATPVWQLNRADGSLLRPDEIAAIARKALDGGAVAR
jgi:2-oxoglutarate ferredoxin oxidoreductase subunit alpha